MKIGRIALATFAVSRACLAFEGDPEATRSQGYCGYPTPVRGDIRTVGMSGATVGLADTVIASHDNPGGLAMTLGEGDLSGSSDTVRDGYLLPWITRTRTNSFGLGLAPYPWGVSFEYNAGYAESVLINNTQLNVSTAEYRFTLARVLLDNHLSLGASVNFGRGEESTVPSGPSNYTPEQFDHVASLGFGVGMQYRFRERLMLGVGFQKGMDYNFTSNGFFEPIHVPYRTAVGLGWIANRYFRTDLTLFGIGGTDNTALLINPDISNGQHFSLQPRAGLAYMYADYREFQSTVFMGSYYETSEIAGTTNRLHVTAGVEFKPWVLSIGWGIDRARQYNNYIFTAGIDPFKVMERLGLIPRPWSPPGGALFPPADALSEEHLARPLMDHWKPDGPDIDPISLGLDLPKKIEKRAKDTQQQIENLRQDIIQEMKPNSDK